MIYGYNMKIVCTALIVVFMLSTLIFPNTANSYCATKRIKWRLYTENDTLIYYKEFFYNNNSKGALYSSNSALYKCSPKDLLLAEEKVFYLHNYNNLTRNMQYRYFDVLDTVKIIKIY